MRGRRKSILLGKRESPGEKEVKEVTTVSPSKVSYNAIRKNTTLFDFSASEEEE